MVFGTIKERSYDAVFTVNYFPLVAQVCGLENEVPHHGVMIVR